MGHEYSLPRDKTCACAETSGYIVGYRLQACKIFTVDITLHVTESGFGQQCYVSLQYVLLSYEMTAKGRTNVEVVTVRTVMAYRSRV